VLENHFISKRVVSLTLALIIAQTSGACLSIAQAHEFSWDDLAMAEIKLGGEFDYQNHVDWYMQKYRPSVWKSCRDDEFTLSDRREETLQMFRSKVQQFDVTQTFHLRARLSLGDYDFGSEAFPIQNMGKNNYWYESIYNSGDMPSKIHVFMTNHEELKMLKMPKSQARGFVSSRKNRSGNVDRRIYAAMELKMVRRRGRGKLEAEVQSATFYSDDAHTRYLGSYQKPVKQKTEEARMMHVTHLEAGESVAPPAP
jgi:hypothetical protein